MTTETITRLASIVDGLAGVGDATRGEPVRSEEWNALVGSVVELAQIAIARESAIDETLAARFAPADHGHAGSVDLAWFEPATRSMIEGGRAERADLRSDLDRTRRDLDASRKEVAELREEVRDLQRQLDGIDDRDRQRSRDVDLLANRVEGLGDNTSSIADLRGTLGTIDTRVGEALALRDELVDPDGNRLDLAVLRADVDELRTIRENLTGADGQLVQYRDFEQRLVAVEENVDLATGGVDLGDLRIDILADAGVALDERVGPLEDRVEGVDERVLAVDERVVGFDDRIAATEATGATHRSQIAALQSSTAPLPGLTTRVGTLENRVNGHSVELGRLAELPEQLAVTSERLEALEGLDPRIAAVEGAQVTTGERLAAVDGLDARVQNLEALGLTNVPTRLATVEARSARQGADLDDIGQRVDVVEATAARQGQTASRLEALTQANRQALILVGERSGRPLFDAGGNVIGGLGTPIVDRPGGSIVIGPIR